MSTLLLRLSAPLQAWGDSSRFSRRSTRREPTKSGVVGLLAAALGRPRTASVDDLAALRFGVRVDQPGSILRDFQVAVSLDGAQRMPISNRYYLADAAFVVGLEGETQIIDALAEAVREPVFPLFLGRRSCPPSAPVFLSRVDEPLEPALRTTPWIASPWYRKRVQQAVDLELVLDADPSTASADGFVETAKDLPVRFDPRHRRYGWRDLARAEPLRVENPDGHGTDPDFMAPHR